MENTYSVNASSSFQAWRHETELNKLLASYVAGKTMLAVFIVEFKLN